MASRGELKNEEASSNSASMADGSTPWPVMRTKPGPESAASQADTTAARDSGVDDAAMNGDRSTTMTSESVVALWPAPLVAATAVAASAISRHDVAAPGDMDGR